MATDNNFQATVDTLFKGMDSFITTKTVVGEAIHINDTIILPLVDVSFGVAASAKAEDKKNGGGGGMGGKMTPSAVLVIQNGTTRLVNIKQQGGITKILDMVPEFVNRFTDKKSTAEKDKKSTVETDKSTEEAAKEAMEEELSQAVENVVSEE